MTTVFASDCKLCSLNMSSASMSDYAWNHYHFAHELTLQVSEHPWSFLTVDLDLELRRFTFILEVVSVIDFLNSFFEL